MFIKIPFESAIEFKTRISEITKMSLEHDFNVNDRVVLGNFYVSGEYKIHEVSINKESFNYTLPFTVELREDIKNDTVEFNIEDFSYEVIKDNTLKVNIEYSLQAEVEEELFERVNEEELESELAYIDEFLSEAPNDKVKNDICDVSENPEEVCERQKEINLEISLEDAEKTKEEVMVEEELEELEKERITKEEEKTIMETIKNSDDTFVTYHIHIVKESESMESICAKYNVSSSLISEYNNIDSMTIGDKILIPKIDE